MKMERDYFASTFGSNSNTNFTTEFNISYSQSHEPNLFNSIFNDPNLQPLLPLPSDPNYSVFNLFSQAQDFPSLPLLPLEPRLQLQQVQVPHLQSSIASLLPSQIPDIIPLPDSTQFLDFFSKPLPDLHCLELELEQPHYRRPARLSDFSSSSSSTSVRKLKPTRLDLTLSDNNPQTHNSIVQSFSSPPPPLSHSELARTRRQKMSKKIRCLQKLMPWDKKMDTSTTLEEAYKYIRFLQAQIFILESMPITSSFASTEHNHNAPLGVDNGNGGLGRLNRQQLL